MPCNRRLIFSFYSWSVGIGVYGVVLGTEELNSKDMKLFVKREARQDLAGGDSWPPVAMTELRCYPSFSSRPAVA